MGKARLETVYVLPKDILLFEIKRPLCLRPFFPGRISLLIGLLPLWSWTDFFSELEKQVD
jgi:hypothetical protein